MSNKQKTIEKLVEALDSFKEFIIDFENDYDREEWEAHEKTIQATLQTCIDILKGDGGEELNPCPFCGSKDLFVERMQYEASAVMCNACGAFGQTCNTEDSAELELIEKNDLHGGHYSAIKYWNTRATALDKLVEELR